jgi:hypothetical protein
MTPELSYFGSYAKTKVRYTGIESDVSDYHLNTVRSAFNSNVLGNLILSATF